MYCWCYVACTKHLYLVFKILISWHLCYTTVVNNFVVLQYRELFIFLSLSVLSFHLNKNFKIKNLMEYFDFIFYVVFIEGNNQRIWTVYIKLIREIFISKINVTSLIASNFMKEKIKYIKKKKIVNLTSAIVDKYPFSDNPIFENFEN